MNTDLIVLCVVALIAANLPWFGSRFLGFVGSRAAGKRAWMRLVEALLLYGLLLVVGFGLERRRFGAVADQGWEFFVVVFGVFAVLGLPGCLMHLWRSGR